MRAVILPALLLLMLPTQSGAQESGAGTHRETPKPEQATTRTTDLTPAQESVCLLIESAAQANGLPVAYFARLIWQESRFRADAVGPLTRSGANALGIAQFMPATASERGLLDPFDPVFALPKSAEFLRDLRREFGNLGLAAAAYNAGPRRVREWLEGTGPMPAETRSYVYAITGATVEEWSEHGRDVDRTLPNLGDCRKMVALLRQAPTPYVDSLERQVNTAAGRPWGVQLSAGLATRYANILSDHSPTVQRVSLRSRGTRGLYQVRVGTDTRSEAETLCNRIRVAGGACMVLRNRRQR
jgi:hypothetical protein